MGQSRLVTYIHCESKRDLYTFAHNFGRCWRIFEIFPLFNSSRNLQQTDCHIAHHTLNVLLHYLVKWQLSQTAIFHIKTMHSTSIVTNKMSYCQFMKKNWRVERWVWGLFSWLRTNSSTWVTLSSVRALFVRPLPSRLSQPPVSRILGSSFFESSFSRFSREIQQVISYSYNL